MRGLRALSDLALRRSGGPGSAGRGRRPDRAPRSPRGAGERAPDRGPRRHPLAPCRSAAIPPTSSRSPRRPSCAAPAAARCRGSGTTGARCSTGCRPAARSRLAAAPLPSPAPAPRRPQRAAHRLDAQRASTSRAATARRLRAPGRRRQGRAARASTPTSRSGASSTSTCIPWVPHGPVRRAPTARCVGPILTPGGPRPPHRPARARPSSTRCGPAAASSRPGTTPTRPSSGCPSSERPARATSVSTTRSPSRVRTTYWTPVLAPAALAYRVYSARGRRRTGAALGPARDARLPVLPSPPHLRARRPRRRMGVLRLPPALHAQLALPPRGRPGAPACPGCARASTASTVYAWDWAGTSPRATSGSSPAVARQRAGG